MDIHPFDFPAEKQPTLDPPLDPETWRDLDGDPIDTLHIRHAIKEVMAQVEEWPETD